MEQRAAVLATACVGLCSGPSTAPSLPAESADSRDEWYFDEFEVVPGLVEVEVAVPRLMPALR